MLCKGCLRNTDLNEWDGECIRCESYNDEDLPESLQDRDGRFPEM